MYTIEEKDLIGRKIAEMLMLRRDREYQDRYQTTWGNKTPFGIFNIIVRIGEEIKEGNILETFKKEEEA